MGEPGDLSDLGVEGAAAWAERVTACLQAATAAPAERTLLVIPPETIAAPAVRVADWPGFPTRIGDCIGRQAALELLDEPTNQHGGRSLQEEYLEWRLVRDSNGNLTRVEFTTELPEYWIVLAAYHPARTLELVAEFADEAAVASHTIYGELDPFASTATSEDRARAFGQHTLSLEARNPYSDGRRALCCMLQPSNTLTALARLAALASIPRAVRDAIGKHLRCLTSAEAVPLLADAARLGRASDPVLVERFGRLAFEGRRIALAEPIGVYIQGVERTRLRTPSGETVPAEWFCASRGSQVITDDALYQRLAFEVPAEEGYGLSDLIDVATEQPIRFGGQLADLVQVAIFATATDSAAAATPPLVTLVDDVDDRGCEEIRSRHARQHELTHNG